MEQLRINEQTDSYMVDRQVETQKYSELLTRQSCGQEESNFPNINSANEQLAGLCYQQLRNPANEQIFDSDTQDVYPDYKSLHHFNKTMWLFFGWFDTQKYPLKYQQKNLLTKAHTCSRDLKLDFLFEDTINDLVRKGTLDQFFLASSRDNRVPGFVHAFLMSRFSELKYIFSVLIIRIFTGFAMHKTTWWCMGQN